MKVFLRVISGVTALLTIFVILITSFQIGIYSDFNWYQKEYEKYRVADDLHMEMTDIMDVTYEMMDYLIDRRGDLVVETTVAGETREFFNDREKAHMVDVKNLFLGGLRLRNYALFGIAAGLFVLIAAKAEWKRLLPAAYQAGLVIFGVVTGVLGYLFSTDYTKYFTIFHETFFTNDLWLLDPDTDLMINMLPEGFFSDMTFRIGSIFIGLLLIGLVISVGCQYLMRKKAEEK